MRLSLSLALSLLLACSAHDSHAAEVKKKPSKQVIKSRSRPIAKTKVAPTPVSLIPGTQSAYRGWDYLVDKLRLDGISEPELRSVYQNPKMPPLGYVSFGLAPKESTAAYTNFRSNKQIKLAKNFLKEHDNLFRRAEEQFGVSRTVIAAILLIETHYGQVTGKELVLNRLSRLAAIGSPLNLEYNFKEHQKKDPSVTFAQVEARARYLETTFYPEVHALFEIARKNKISPLSVKGSSAGAFGIPQFLPSSFLRFGVDGDHNKIVSLFNVPDAILSTANFLKAAGWTDHADRNTKRAVLWKYNRSDPYVDAVLDVAALLS